MTVTTEVQTRRPQRGRAVPRPLSGRGRLRRARRRADLLRVVRRGRAHRAVPAHLVDHPLEALEGADPLLRAPPQGAHLRRARQRALRPAARHRRLRRSPVRGRHPRRDGRHRDRERAPGRSLRRGALGDPARRGPSRPGRWGRLHRRGGAARPRASRAHALPVRRAARDRRGLGEAQPALLAEGLPRLPRVLLRPDVHRAAFDEADRGLHRLGPRDRPRDDDRHHPRAGSARGLSGQLRTGALSGDGHPRHRRRGPPARGRGGARGRDGRRARLAGGLGARPSRARPGQGEPAAARLRRAAPPEGVGVDPREEPPPPRPVHLLTDRARARPARRRDRQGAAAARARPRDRLARPEPGDQGARGGG